MGLVVSICTFIGYTFYVSQFQHICLNPKDRELCQHRLKSDENLMEDRSGTDVQIVSSNVGIAAKD